MKHFIQVMAVLFVLSAISSMFAALGMQRLPDREPPVLEPPSGVIEHQATAVSDIEVLHAVQTARAAQAAQAVAPAESLLERLMKSLRTRQTETLANLAVEQAPAEDKPEEEHIEGTDKPESLDETPATTGLLPEHGDQPVLVNRDNVLPREYVPELAAVQGTYYQLTPETLAAYTELMKAAKEAGHNKLRLQSAYRSYDTQHSLHERKVGKLKATYGDQAREKAAQIVARPGESEHQLGQAVDIANGSLVQSFGSTPAGIWMAENVHKFGFILRYPEGKTHITGILYEPWHFRYVGVEVATVIYENSWTLEEYFQHLQ